MNPVEVIRKTRDGEALSEAEIRYFTAGAADGSIPDYQVAAFLMAYYFQDMVLGRRDPHELAYLTQSVAESGDVLDFGRDFELLFDKHSTGGVGDKLSFICAPLMAACGCPSLLLSGRGLGHTGGTLDKMESVSGMRVLLDRADIVQNLKSVGLVICGQTGSIAPTDKKLYALRDVTATVPSIGLIAASILGKKMAVKPTCLVLDVKVGTGAFMVKESDARALAETMLGILKASSRKTAALLTRMDEPLGRMVGNALEIEEVLQVLANPDDPGVADLVHLGVELAAQAVALGQKLPLGEARQLVTAKLRSGEGLEKFIAFMSAQGGDVQVLRQPERLPKAAERIVVKSPASGFVGSINSYEIGIASNLLGAGRFRAEDQVDPAVGIELLRKTGDSVREGDELFALHVNARESLREAHERATRAYAITEEKPSSKDLIIDILN